MASSVDVATAAAATTSITSTVGPMSLLDDFLRSQPFLSAFMMCGFKASAADLLAQTSEHESDDSASETSTTVHKANQPKNIDDNNGNNIISHYHYMIMDMIQTHFHQHNEVPDEDNGNEQINLARNVAFLLYGGLYQGMFLQLLYMVVYPFLYGDSFFRIPLCICTDVFMFGPFVTLPIAYIIRAVIDNIHDDDNVEEAGTIREAMLLGIDKYKNHIVTQDLLLKYWSIWAPAQSINNIFVPEHLRVFFVAFVSFFWVFLLSLISNQESTDCDEKTMNAVKHEPARQTT